MDKNRSQFHDVIVGIQKIIFVISNYKKNIFVRLAPGLWIGIEDLNQKVIGTANPTE